MGITMKSAFPFHGRMFTRNQLFFIVEVMIASTIDTISNCIPLRWVAGHKDAEWEREKATRPLDGAEASEPIGTSLHVLSWNLSILFAQLTNDGMGCGDALYIANVGDTIEQWGNDLLTGKRGIIADPDDPNSGHVDEPDRAELAQAWVNAAFKDIKLPEERKL